MFVILACAYGLVYLVALLRRRQDWAVQVRPDNIRLAFATMGLALLLATPLIGFNAISANSQVARLTSGRVAVDTFDWAALGFDFGEPGRRALEQLSKSPNVLISGHAIVALKSDNRWNVAQEDERRSNAASLDKRLRILPKTVPIPPELRDRLTTWGACGSNDMQCVLLYTPGAAEAVAIGQGCIASTRTPACHPQRYVTKDGKWVEADDAIAPADATTAPARRAALATGKVGIRTVPRRQVFVGDQPVGDPFE